MLLTNVVLVSGTLIYGVRLHQKKKREAATPWTVYADRLRVKKNNLTAKSAKKGAPLASGKYLTAKTALQKFQEEQISPFFPTFGSQSDTRRLQLSEMSKSAEEDDGSEAEKEVNRYFAISTVALALTTGGALLYPPLNILSVPALLITINPLLVSAYHSLVKEKKVGVAVLDSIGTIGPLVMGHFFVAALASWLSNLSRKLLIKTEDQSRNSLTNVFGEQPSFVFIHKDGIEVEISFKELKIGDLVVVDSGHAIPVDGTIGRGMASIDQRTLTGESQPVEKGVGDEVFASTFVLEGRIYIQVEKAGSDTVAAQIGEILNRTADFKSSIQSQGEKVVEQGAIPTILVSALTLPLLGAESALAALYAAFGYHMRFAAPVSVLNFLRITSENGILIKDGRSLELLSQVDTFVFDKTGTLTEEVPTVGKIYTCNGYSHQKLLTYAAAAEHKQTHPIAQAIRQEAEMRNLNPPPINEAKVEVGYGLKVRVEEPSTNTEHLIHVGSGRFMEMQGVAITADIKKIEEDCYEEGSSLVYVAIDEQLGGVIELRPTIRPEAKGIISELRKRHFSLIIISGDHEAPTQKLAQELGIDHYFAETLPQNKASLIERLQKEGKSVCFVGDGINDSIALKKANVSVSLRGASTIATDTASIILMDDSLKKLIKLLDIAQELDANLSRSTALTMLPGIVCIGGVYFFHFGLVSAIMLYNIGLATSVSNALWPLIKHQRRKSRGLNQDSPHSDTFRQVQSNSNHHREGHLDKPSKTSWVALPSPS
ncbi:MAG: heavy metal translocating P-type ATPase [Ardenticatenaceae bacterium]